MADIPGLIEGAGEGVGLGHEFLKHVERCRMLVHVLDAAGSEGRDPLEDYEIINRELAVFNPDLVDCPQIMALNKIDLAEDEQLERLHKFFDEKGIPYFDIIAPIQEGTKELINAVAAKLQTLPPVKRYEPETVPIETLAKKQNNGFKITELDGVYYVEAEWILKILNKTDMEDYESLQYLQRVLENSGVFDALRRRGIQDGDTVSIYDFEFEFVP